MDYLNAAGAGVAGVAEEDYPLVVRFGFDSSVAEFMHQRMAAARARDMGANGLRPTIDDMWRAMALWEYFSRTKGGKGALEERVVDLTLKDAERLPEIVWYGQLDDATRSRVAEAFVLATIGEPLAMMTKEDAKKEDVLSEWEKLPLKLQGVETWPPLQEVQEAFVSNVITPREGQARQKALRTDMGNLDMDIVKRALWKFGLNAPGKLQALRQAIFAYLHPREEGTGVAARRFYEVVSRIFPKIQLTQGIREAPPVNAAITAVGLASTLVAKEDILDIVDEWLGGLAAKPNVIVPRKKKRAP